jgi:hypothetical protein
MATNIVLKRSASAGSAPGTSDLELGELALNTYDGKMYMKKTVSGTSSIVELTGTRAATSSAFAHDSYKYVASGSTTTFTGSDADSKTLAYTAGQIQVFLNGVLLDVADYTASNGTSVVLASAASSGDILYIVSFKGTNPFDYFKYTATNAQTSFSGNDANSESLVYTAGNITVHLNGVLLDASDYTATTGTAVVLASGASTGDILVIHEFNETGLTDLSADTTPQLGGNLDLVTYDIVSTSNRDIDIIPHGTGNINLGTDTVSIGTSGENITVTSNGTGDMTLSTNSGTNSGTIVIADGVNSDITLTPNGTGDVIIDGLKYPQADGSADQVLKTDGSGQLSFTTISSAAITDADGDTKIQVEESSDEDTIRFDIAGTEQIVLADGVLKPTTDNDIDLGTSSLEFKDAFFDGTVKTDALTVDAGSTLTGAVDANSTLNLSGTLSLDGSANELRFYEGANYVGFEAPSLSADQIWVLPTADGSSGQMLKTDGSGTLSWATASSTVTGLTDTTISSLTSGDMLRYNGSAWVNQATAAYPVLNTMTGDNSDTTLTLTRAPLHENAVQVYWDGVYQHKDNWAVSGTTLTFATAPPTGVKVEAVTGSQTNMLYGHDVTVDKMTGDASDTTLALSVTPSNENHTNIYFDGVYQSKDNYTLSGTTVTFSTAPPTGVLVEAVSNQSVAVGTATAIAASAITGLTEVTAADADHVLVYDASGSALKKSLVSDLVQTSEEIADIVGAMVSSNTESGITVAYQDGDNTLDFTVGTLNQDTTGTADLITASANNSTDETVYPTFVDGATGSQGIETDTGLTYNPSTGLLTTTLLAGTLNTAAQTNITSLGTLTSLTVDDITINGSTISDGGDLTLDVAGDIILDADGADIIFKDGGTSFGKIQNSSTNMIIESLVSDKDIQFYGNDGGSSVLALTLDMSDSGKAYFGSSSGPSILRHASNSHDYFLSGSGRTAAFGQEAGGYNVKFSTSSTVFEAAGATCATIASDGDLNLAKSARIAQVAITSSSSAVAWNAKTAANAYHVTTENTTFSAPSNAVEGAVISVELAQGGTARTIAWNTVFEFAASTAPTVTATANKTDIFTFRYNGSVWQEIGRVQNMAQT